MNHNRRATPYRWENLDQDHPLELISRRRIVGANAMIAQITLKKGCVVPVHTHENEQFAIMLSGCLCFTLGDDPDPDQHTLNVSAGEVLHLPPNIPHGAEAMVDSVALDVFSPPSATTGIDT